MRLAQHDPRALDPRFWRNDDYVTTDFRFGLDLDQIDYKVIRVGLYHFDEASSLQAIYALDEQGGPWLYAVDIAYDAPCQP